MTNLNTLFNIIVKMAWERDAIPGNFERSREVISMLGRSTAEDDMASRENEISLWNFKNYLIADVVAEYQARGGKRDVCQFVKADR